MCSFESLQAGIDHVFSWYQGVQVAALCPLLAESDLPEDEEDDEDPQTDGDVLKQDLVKVCHILIRMNIYEDKKKHLKVLYY